MKCEQKQIKDICEFIGGSQPPKSEFIHEQKEGYVRLIQIRDRLNDKFITYIPEKSTTKFCEPDDILIGRYGPPIFQIFRGFKGAYNVAIMKANPLNGVNKDFLYYFLLQDSILKYVESMSARTAGQTGVELDSLYEYPVRLPDMDGQEKIVGVLKAIDDKIRNNNAIGTELEAMARTIYDYWFLQYDFPDEKGKPYKSSGGKMVWNEELKREIPDGWKSGNIADLGEIVAGGTPPTTHPEYYIEKGIAWITPNDLSNTSDKYISHGERDISQLGLNNSSAKLMPKGTVLFTSRAPIGYIGIAMNEVCTNQGFKSIVPYEKFGSEFVYYTVLNMVPYIKLLGSGSTFTEVSKDVIAKVKIVIPEEKIVEKFNNTIITIGEKKAQAEKENKELASLRDFLLPLLMNGQVGFREC